ncbi:MAG: replication-associated recombination protein A [Ruminococcaceae bacterium]|nr:replication-associated recombination protein A [Oscillospiraceae bacterium]
MPSNRITEELRPRCFDDIVGQTHLFGEKGVVRKMIESGRVTNMIFYGPPGTGKTTAAEIIARESGMVFHRLNATTASISDVKDVLTSANSVFCTGGILLYIDEIQYFNRKQQQALLEYIEDGRVTLIASTTENPHFYIYNAIISRSSLFEFKPVPPAECIKALERAVAHLNEREKLEKTASADTLEYIARATSGDVRHAIVLLENSYFAAEKEISREVVDGFNVRVGNFDDDTHFDLLSCLQKSIRGSDPDAAIFYVAKLLSLGELISVCRRLQVIASEDIGQAYPLAAAVTRACCESAKEMGMPEARIPLANAAIMLATAPKSNSAEAAIDAALADIEAGRGRIVPPHLQSPLFKGYKYPHDYKNHYVEQQYLPDDLKDRKYYSFGQNKNEDAARIYWEKIKGEKS